MKLPDNPTVQEIFDITATHLLTQNQKSHDQRKMTATCMYRGPNGLKCAAGIWIPDEEYVREMEGIRVCGLAAGMRANKDWKLPDLFYGGYELVVLGYLQQIHDTSDPLDWRRKLRALAKSHNLSTVVIDNFEKAATTPCKVPDEIMEWAEKTFDEDKRDTVGHRQEELEDA